jgi:hypothetical protein
LYASEFARRTADARAAADSNSKAAAERKAAEDAKGDLIIAHYFAPSVPPFLFTHHLKHVAGKRHQ